MGEPKCYEDAILDGNHALIAGCSGSGKSVAINAILFRAISRGGKAPLLMLIDLKRVELMLFREYPGTIAYADNLPEAKNTLKWALRIIESRFARMQAERVRKSSEAPIYIVIDEYADMVALDKSVNVDIQRISQIGRAANVHLIIATQRPTASDVLPGAIKVNLEVRLALRCMTAQDSRNIIGIKGAETLPRYGEGILQHEGYNYFTEITMISDATIIAQVNAWKEAIWQQKHKDEPVTNTKKRSRRSLLSFLRHSIQTS